MKRAIVLAGGGAKGAYQIGFWKALRELNIDFDMVVGSSVGALNAALMAQGNYDDGERMWAIVETKDVFEKTDSKIKSMFNTELLTNGLKPIFGDLASDAVNKKIDPFPLEKFLDGFLHEDQIRENGKVLGIMTTEYPAFRCAPFFLTDIPKGRLNDYLLASSTVFPSMEPKTISGVKYIDGGYSDNSPVNMVLDAGADEVIVCLLNGSGVIGKYMTDKPVRTVRPHFYLGAPMDFNPEVSKNNIILGYNDTMRSFGNFDGHFYTFRKGETEKFLKDYSYIFSSQSVKFGLCRGSEISRYYETRAVKSFADAKGVRFGTMKRTLPLLAAENAAELFGVNPACIYTEEEFEEAVLKAYTPETGSENKIYEILDVAVPIPIKTKLLAEIDKKTIVSYIAESMQEADNDKSVRMNVSLVSRLAPSEFFTAVYLAVIRGYIR